MKVKFVLIGAGIAGAAVPLLFSTASRLGYHFFGSTIDLVLWPSSILLMNEQETPESPLSYVFGVSVLANVVYYGIVACLAWATLMLVRRILERHDRN